ncbi:MAG: porin family protein [Prevotella sp.]|nr:porin family protein [Prevotella sp.]
MKKARIILFALTLALSLGASAQTKFGLRAGANLVNMKISDGIDNLQGNNRAGFYIGPTVKFTLPIVGLGVDVSAVYDQRTSEVSAEDDLGNTTTENVTARAINIPINVRYGVGLGSLADIFVFAGPQFGFNISKDKMLGVTDWTWRSSNFSVNLGVGCTVLSHLEVKANYNIACGKTAEATTMDAVTKTVKSVSKSKYNSWQIGVAYYF